MKRCIHRMQQLATKQQAKRRGVEERGDLLAKLVVAGARCDALALYIVTFSGLSVMVA